jgi:hypothetical protein
MSDFSIRKVKVLQGRAKAEAEKQGLNSEDLVIVKTSVKSGSLPNYHIEKIEGDPVSYLLKRVEQEIKEKSENYAKLCARLHEQVIDLTLKNKELKQKLQHILSEEYPENWSLLAIAQTRLRKISELLKEV